MLELRTFKFVAPSGHSFTIREQNGEDEDILSNPREMRHILHLSRYISAIVTDTDFTSNGKLTFKDALKLPLLDRYAILFNSRIFSLGDVIEFTYTWISDNGNKNEVVYEEDLNNYLFDYSKQPSEEELENKPNAIPYYPDASIISGKEFTLSTGKKIWWQAATGNSEQYLLNLPEEKRTRNAEKLARNLMLEVEGKFEKVSNFSLFSTREMAEIQKLIKTYDPQFMGLTDITNPQTGEIIQYPIIAAPSFFFLIEE